MAWTQVNFGKYKGKTLPQIVLTDPDWFFWAYDEGIFRGKGRVEVEAEQVYQRATSIRIPSSENQHLVAEYVIHQPTGKFGDLNIVPASRPPHVGSSPTFRKPVIDLSVPRQVSKYDKTGGRLIINAVKDLLFGSGKKLTKQRCEMFFDDESNFFR